MGRIKDGFNNLGTKLKTLPGGRQGKAFVRIIQFFALMVVLTIFARGAAGATMPLVTTTALTSQTIRNSADYGGTVVSAGRTEVKLPAGLTVTRVHVYPGSTVKEGDDLVSFDMEAVNESVTTQQIALQELKLALAELQKPLTQDDSALESAKKAVASAQKEYDTTVATNNQNIKAAEDALNAAKNAVNNAKKAEQKAKENLDKFANTGTGADGWPVEGDPNYTEYMAAKLIYVTAQQTTIDAIASEQANIKAAQTGLNNANALAEELRVAAQEVIDNANAALAEAQADYNEATPSFDLQNQKNQLEIKKKQQEIATQQEVLDELFKLQGLSGAVRAPVAGTVTEVTATTEAPTAETDHVYISTGAEGYEVQFSVPQAKAREIKAGNQVSVMLQNSYWPTEARVVGKGLVDEGGNVMVRAQLSSTDWNEGDGVTVTVVSSDRQYWSTVPVAAVRPDSDGYYVLIVTEKSTILGTQSVATKIAVTVDDQDATNAAVSLQFTDAYIDNPQIIVSSNKPVNDGDLVRLDEASTQ